MKLVELSAVLQVIDGFSGQPAQAAQLNFLLDGKACFPQARAQAFYVFSDLAPGAYTLDVISRDHRFFDQRLSLQVSSQANLQAYITTCTLQAAPAYPYPAQQTMLRGQILRAGRALPDVQISAHYQTARAQVKQVSTLSSSWGRYQGRYALPLSGKLAENTQVELAFVKPGLPSLTRQIHISSGNLQVLDIEMQ